MTVDQTKNPIDETVIEALRAQASRYDVAIVNELVLSVLPNGVKTWTWVYDDPADPHRKTLGIYPDMTLEDAKKSLAAEKAAYRRAAAEASPEFVIRDGRIQPVERSASQLSIVAGAAGAVLVGAILAWLFLDRDAGDRGSAGAPQDDEILKPVAESVAEIQLPSVTPTQSEATIPSEPVATETQAPSLPPSEERVGTLTRTLEKPPASPKRTSTTATDNRPVVNGPPVLQQESKLQDTSVPVAGPPVAPGTASLAADRSAVGRRVPADGSQNDLLLDPRVARGRLTTAVSQREPVDDLGTDIVGNGADEQKYYFYTELRELSGQRLRHRWIYNDRIVAEIPFDVGQAWRWRVYSSKTFIPSMAGPWRAQVVLDDETVIFSLPFNFTP